MELTICFFVEICDKMQGNPNRSQSLSRLSIINIASSFVSTRVRIAGCKGYIHGLVTQILLPQRLFYFLRPHGNLQVTSSVLGFAPLLQPLVGISHVSQSTVFTTIVFGVCPAYLTSLYPYLNHDRPSMSECPKLPPHYTGRQHPENNQMKGLILA